ncbi:MAG TPA: hypothetical protein VMF50_14065 [Candidatus Binataceae bacterium]|nr:hypothetical protein [Candidatus Binataceae bacterium]
MFALPLKGAKRVSNHSKDDSFLLRNEMGRHDADELTGCDYLGRLPELWKMPLIARHQIVSTRSIGALQKLIVGRVLRDPEGMRRADNPGMILYELEQLRAESLADFEFWA